MENFAEIIDFRRGDALPFSDSVNRTAADVVLVNQRIGTFTASPHSFPKFVVHNHLITLLKRNAWYSR